MCLSNNNIKIKHLRVCNIENWIEKSLATFDARIWLQYDKDGEYATNLRCKGCTQFREHIEGIQYFKEDWITWKDTC